MYKYPKTSDEEVSEGRVAHEARAQHMALRCSTEACRGYWMPSSNAKWFEQTIP